MANIKFFWDNIWDEKTIVYSSQSSNFPATNTQLRWRLKPWRSNYGTNSGWGHFEITAANAVIYWNSGSDESATITTGIYNADTLATEIEAAMDAVEGTSGINFVVIYSDTTNKFEIHATDTGVTFQLRISETTNDIWTTIGFDIGTDTGFANFFVADEVRIHTSEYLYVTSLPITVEGCFIFHHNLQTTATIEWELSDDAFVTIPVTVPLTRSTDARDMYAYLLSNTLTYRYQRIKITDIDNPAGYVELGRIWMGEAITPRIGRKANSSTTFKDNSITTKSDGGQKSTIQRPREKRSTYKFDLISKAERTLLEAALEDRGNSLPVVLLELPKDTTTGTFEEAETYSFYVTLKNPRFRHLAGALSELTVQDEEEN